MFHRFKSFVRHGFDVAKNDRAYIYLNLGTFTGLVGFCMSDPLPLRTCSITSSLTGLYFQLTRVPVQSYVPIYWSCCFMAVNIYKIVELLVERRTVRLTEAEEDLYCRHFQRSGMRPTQFQRLMENSVARAHKSGAIIAEEGQEMPKTVVLLTNGTVRIQKNKEDIYVVDASKPICFLGDTHLLNLADKKQGIKEEEEIPALWATAIAETPDGEDINVIEWDNEYLLSLLTSNSEISHTLRTVLTQSVIQKLVGVGGGAAVDKYTTLLSACAADGEVNVLEKKLLRDYAESHQINGDVHNQCLQRIGWTPAEFERGRKLKGSTIS